MLAGLYLRGCILLNEYLDAVKRASNHQYRQFALRQPNEEWNDIAIIITFNVIVWLGAVLY